MQPVDVISKLKYSTNSPPVWIGNQQSLFWVDQANLRLFQYHIETAETTTHELSEPILTLSPSNNHGFIATLEDGIGFYDMKERKVTYISKPEPMRPKTIIGGVTDNQGSYWSFIRPNNLKSKQGSLYQITPTKETQRFTGEHLLCSAPPSFSKDSSTLYQSAGKTRYIYVTTLDEQREPIETHAFCRIPKAEGYPHGLCVDSEDNLWVCHREVGLLSCYNKQGECIEKIKFDAPGLSYCVFGGELLDTLFIITANIGDPENKAEREQFRHVNAVVSFKPGAIGVETQSFTG